MLKRFRFIHTGILTAIILVAVLLSGCTQSAAKNGDTVQVNYTLTLKDGTTYETSAGKEPLELVMGQGKFLPDFENALVGMKEGESKTINIPAANAYGERRDDMIITIERSKLAPGVEPVLGSHLQGTDDSGQIMVAIIIAVNDTTVIVDANHPLAGQDLTFKLDLLKIN